MAVLVREQAFPRRREELFAFFADPSNLEAITPPWLNFRIVTPMPVQMGAGTLLDYRLRLFKVPFGWRTRIEAWDPPRRFRGVQIEAPYATWYSRHEFEERDGGTLMRDTVRYAVPCGPLGAAARVLLVRRWLDRIFDFRRDVLADRYR